MLRPPPPGAIRFRAEVMQHSADNRLLPHTAPVNVIAPAVPPVPAMSGALLQRSENFMTHKTENPPKRFRHTEDDVDQTDHVTMLKRRRDSVTTIGDRHALTKKFLHYSFKEQLRLIKMDPLLNFPVLLTFTEKLLTVMSYEASSVSAMGEDHLITWDEMVKAACLQELKDADDVTMLDDIKEYASRLKKHNHVGTTLVKDLLDDSKIMTEGATVANKAYLAKELQLTNELLDTTKELVNTKKLLNERTEVMYTLLLASEVPSCIKCNDFMSLSIDYPMDYLNMTSCGRQLCNFCSERYEQMCSDGTCGPKCKTAYKVTFEDYLNKIKKIRRHVMDTYPHRVIEFNEFAPLPPFLATYNEDTHEQRLTDAASFNASASDGEAARD
jgi:hypothetical protein